MPFEFSNQARGLSALLALRSGGIQPNTLAELVAPIIDLSDLFLLNGRQTIGFNQIVGVAVGRNDFPAPGPLADAVVPPGEMWYVWDALVQATLGAGVAVDVACGCLFDSSIVIAGPTGAYEAGAANQDVRAHIDRPLWLGPGSRMVALVRSVTGAVTVSGAAVVTRLKI